MADEVKVSKFANARNGIIKFFKEIRSELKKVIWLNRAQLTNNTITVLAACIIVGILIWSADAVLAELAKRFLTNG